MIKDLRHVEPKSSNDSLRMLEPHWWALYVGTLVLVSIYYLNYGRGSVDGESDTSNPLTLALKLLSVACIVWSLRPFHLRFNISVLLLIFLYLVSIASMLFATGTYGSSNDTLFLNTVIQLPVLFAFTSTQCDIDFSKWLRFIGLCLMIQVPLDVWLWLNGISLWTAKSFVGGLGNPSSFGLFCVVLFAFYLMHPKAGKGRLFVAAVMAVGAVMSKSLFAVLALAIVTGVWLMQDRRRMVIGVITIATSIIIAILTPSDVLGISFIEHKLNALGALVGLVEYDIESSASVSVRLQIHTETFDGLEEQPLAWLIGHLNGQPYWPKDSQLLTYIGSFGVIMLAIFLILHFSGLKDAFQGRRNDGGFAFIALGLFSFIFATNRILDYFPVATLYFACIAMAFSAVRREIPGQILDEEEVH